MCPFTYHQKHCESFLIEISSTGNVQQYPATGLIVRFTITITVLLRHAVLRIRDVYSGSDFFPSRIWDPDRIRIKEFKILTHKTFPSSRKYDPKCSSRIRILIFLTQPGSRGCPYPYTLVKRWSLTFCPRWQSWSPGSLWRHRCAGHAPPRTSW